MDLSQYVTQLREDLTSAASAGDEQTRRTAALLAGAIEPAARLAIMNALADVAAEITEALGDRVVDVRLDGRDVRVAVGPGADADPQPEEPDPHGRPSFQGFTGTDAGDISRITLRLVEQIKSQAEKAAAAQGVSLNSWVAQAVQGALGGHSQRSGRGGRGGRGDMFGGDGRDGRNLRGWVQG
ncbi:MAG: toxin-antitoxin system HicB family antitoxin [Pseudonocardia sp.]